MRGNPSSSTLLTKPYETLTAQFNPDRFDLARRRRGLTKRAIAEALGLSARSLTRYLKGESEPEPSTVERMGSVLDFPVGFFYGPTLDEIAPQGPSFRALSRMTSRQRDQALAAGAFGAFLSDWIDTHFGLPEPNIPQYEGAEPEAAAMSVRKFWGLGERPVRNMIHLLELHGVRVFALADDTHVVDAYSFWRSTTPFVFLNTTKRHSAERGRMDAAHELGHLVLHSRGGSQRSREAEQEAQQFGAAFLMPRASVLARMRRGSTLPQIIEGKRHWKVSATNLTYRLRQLNLLTKHQYTSAFIEMSQLGYRTTEPETISRETSQVLERIFDRLRSRDTTVARVADEMCLHPQELGKLLLGLVNFPLEA